MYFCILSRRRMRRSGFISPLIKLLRTRMRGAKRKRKRGKRRGDRIRSCIRTSRWKVMTVISNKTPLITMPKIMLNPSIMSNPQATFSTLNRATTVTHKVLTKTNPFETRAPPSIETSNPPVIETRAPPAILTSNRPPIATSNPQATETT